MAPDTYLSSKSHTGLSSETLSKMRQTVCGSSLVGFRYCQTTQKGVFRQKSRHACGGAFSSSHFVSILESPRMATSVNTSPSPVCKGSGSAVTPE